MSDFSEKKIKAVEKEGGKKGQDLAGMSEMGLCFQQANLVEPCGHMELMEMAFAAMNKEVDPEAEERRGGAGEVAKILLSADIDRFCAIIHVPEQFTSAEKNDRQYEISAIDWAKAAFATLPGDGKGVEFTVETPTLVKAVYTKDPDAGRYPEKAKDNVSGASFGWLRSKQLVLDDDSDSDEMVFGDDDMPGI
eukprot:TRINITY_DN53_c0_g1_i1.p2 TRINITY_DN53_c0_g1~~TRINITY_DN53_c0_g1_i1.p2  ORF type:complete len:193 (+),score=105.66 TRINITY_DN53_c0_g1_i1:92-670(+)